MEGAVEMVDKENNKTPPVSTDDLLHSFERVTGEVDEKATTFHRPGIVIASVVVTGIILIAFALGRRAGRKRSTVVEIVRV
ncbi:MAG: hypothetical protein CL464_05835 [Acidimicrobiaceae bacterium]|nr:hypothetical protein [Acidimicrobiaceae bacterium]